MKSNKKYTIAIASLAFAMLGLLIPSNAFAVSWEDATHVIYGDELKTIGDLDTNAVIHFTGNPDGLKGFELYDKSLAPNTSNCQSGWSADEYAVCIFETKNMALGYHEWFDRTTDTWGKFYVMSAPELDTSADTSEDVLSQAKHFKAQIEAKIDARIDAAVSPLQSEIIELKNQLDNSEQTVKTLNSQIIKLESNADDNEAKHLEESKRNAELQEQISGLQAKLTDSTELDKAKQDAAKWKAVAFEQLRVMAEVLGLI